MKITTTLRSLTVLWMAFALPCAFATPPAAVPNPTPVPIPAPKLPPSSPSPETQEGKPSLKDCNKQADTRNLTGKARANFVKDCQAGKSGAGG